MERGNILRREIAEVDARCKDGGTARAELPGGSEVNNDVGLALAAWIVPIPCREATLPIQARTLGECTFEDIVGDEIRTALIDDVRSPEGLPHGIEHGDGATWRAVVVAPLGHAVGGIGADHGNPLALERQQVTPVLEEHD